jgi:cAMP-dependent protein kinase regulator
MPVTLAQATARARRLLADDHLVPALQVWKEVLTQQPLADDVRLAVAGALAVAGRVDESGQIYRSLAMHLMRAGRPLPAVAAAHALHGLGLPFDFLLESIAEMYAAGSPNLGPFAARPAPLDPNLPIEGISDDDVDAEVDPGAYDQLVATLVARGTDFTSHPPYQDQIHPIAFLSELTPESLLALLHAMSVETLAPGGLVVEQGAPGDSIYWVAGGRLRVVTRGPDGSDRGLAELFENSLFGEMALVTNQPRGASVVASEDAVVLALAKQDLDDMRARMPSLEASLTRFTRERLIRNLLTTSPLFTPFTKDQQSDLLKRFEGIEVPAGTVVIHEGDQGAGLYVVLSGALEVSALHGSPSSPVLLATLGPGDVFGEISLVTGLPTSATVQARVASALMFLPRIYVDRLAEAVPEVKHYFAALTERRSAQNLALLAPGGLPEEPVEIDDSDALLF